MRKQFKKKKHSCAMCKPHKMCGDCRWKPKEKEQIISLEKDKKKYIGEIENEYFD